MHMMLVCYFATTSLMDISTNVYSLLEIV